MLNPNSYQEKPFVSAQPENRTSIEEALEFAWHEILTTVDQPYPNLKQPLYTPQEFVSLLAGERGALDWQPSDDEQQRRETTDKAFDIHRKAGTRSGIEIALNALGCDAIITPWFDCDTAKPPYYIECVAWKSNAPVDKQLSERMIRRIESAKSERDTIDFIVALGVTSGFELSGVEHNAVIEIDKSLPSVIQPSPTIRGNIRLVGAGYQVMETGHCPNSLIAPPPTTITSICWGGGTRFIVVTDFTFGVKIL